MLLLVLLGLGVVKWYRPELVQKKMFIPPRQETWVLTVGQTRKEFPQSGGALAALLSIDTPELVRRCVVQPSPGSTYNLQAVVSGQSELGLVQSQVFYPGQHETSASHALHVQVRVLGQLFTSMLTLLATEASGIQNISDLKGKRVGVVAGSPVDARSLRDLLDSANLKEYVPPSGSEAPALTGASEAYLGEHKQAVVPTSETLASAAQHSPTSSAPANPPTAPNIGTDVRLTFAETDTLIRMMKNKDLDAVFVTAAHPSEWTRRMLLATNAHIVPLLVDLDQLQSHSRAYVETSLPANLYPLSSLGVDIPSIGSTVMLVGSSKMSDPDAYEIAKTLTEGLSTLRQQPQFRDLTASALVDGVKLEDFHPGALRYYQKMHLITQAAVERRDAQDGVLSLLSGVDIGIATAVEHFLDGVLRGGGRSRAPIELARFSKSPDQTELLNQLVAAEFELGLLPDEPIESGTKAPDSNSYALPLDGLRSICRLPGAVAQLAVGTDTPMFAVRDLSEQTLAYTSEQSAPLRRWILEELRKEELPPPHWLALEPAAALQAYLNGDIGGFLDFSGLPSALVKSAEKGRPSRLVSLYSVPGSHPPSRELLPMMIQAQGYPAELAADVPSWMTPVALVSSRLVPNDALTQLVARLQKATFAGLTAYNGLPLDWAWMRQAPRYQQHEVLAQAEAGSPTQAESNPPTTGTVSPPTVTPHSPSPATSPNPETWVLTSGSPSQADYSVISGLAEYVTGHCHQDLTGSAACPEAPRLVLLPTASKAESLKLVNAREADFALASADLLQQAIAGQGEWRDSPLNNIRALGSLYVYALTVLASNRETLMGAHVAGGGALKSGERRPGAEANMVIRDFQGLEGRRVSMRHTPGSGPRNNAITLFSQSTFYSSFWQYSLVINEAIPEEATQLFLDGSVVAMFLMAAHPDPFVEAVFEHSNHTTLLPVTGLDDELQNLSYLVRTNVNLSDYDGQQQNPRLISTIGIPMILVAHDQVSDKAVTELLASIIAERDGLKSRMPILGDMSPGFMANTTGIETHPAAAALYKQVLQP